MAVPTTRNDFKAWCLRRLGAPVIEINVDDDQVDDRIDEALTFFADHHYDATELVYYKYLVTPTDITNRFITLPDNIIGAVRCFDVGLYMGNDNMFGIRYQIALNDLYTLTSQSMVPYFMAMENLATIQELLVGHQPIRFNRRSHILHLDCDWNVIQPGTYIIVEAYQVVDPAAFADIWKDRWLGRYAAALIKMEWGNNLKKYTGMTLPGGIQFNGQKIYDEAMYEIDKLEQEARSSFELPPQMFLG